MQKYYKERYTLYRHLSKQLSNKTEVNNILETLRDETKNLVPGSMENCILLIDPNAERYTRPLQCALHERPVNCISCKRERHAVKKALKQNKGVVISKGDPLIRDDGRVIEIGPEAAIPIWVNDDIVGVYNVVKKPGLRFTKKDFYLIRDLSEIAGNFIMITKRHWEVTQEKIKITQIMSHLSSFVPVSVRKILSEDSNEIQRKREKRHVTVLFLDLEGYTKLSERHSEVYVNELVERIFSNFVDPIHRSGGEINETAGDGLMIIFQRDDAKTNAINAVKTALDIDATNRKLNNQLPMDLAPINVNMGIDSGEALVGMREFRGALATRMTYTATGRVTNVAARLADLAKGGDILITMNTRELIGDFWKVYDIGKVMLKGVHSQIRIYSLKNPDASFQYQANK